MGIWVASSSEQRQTVLPWTFLCVSLVLMVPVGRVPRSGIAGSWGLRVVGWEHPAMGGGCANFPADVFCPLPPPSTHTLQALLTLSLSYLGAHNAFSQRHTPARCCLLQASSLCHTLGGWRAVSCPRVSLALVCGVREDKGSIFFVFGSELPHTVPGHHCHEKHTAGRSSSGVCWGGVSSSADEVFPRDGDPEAQPPH